MVLFLEMIFAWVRYWGVMLINGIMSLLSIVLFPVAYFFRYILKVDLLFFLLSNDPEDGDRGAEWWLEKHNLKPGFFTSWRWTNRNSAWYFKNKVFVPFWNAQTYTIEKVIFNTVGHPMEWVDQKMRGRNYVFYRVNGRLYFKLSFTNRFLNMYLGTGSKRYVWKCRRSHQPKHP